MNLTQVVKCVCSISIKLLSLEVFKIKHLEINLGYRRLDFSCNERGATNKILKKKKSLRKAYSNLTFVNFIESLEKESVAGL